ncbi:MAG: hypothetical protein ACFCVE_01790 [Phycisphaerae bacterium]
MPGELMVLIVIGMVGVFFLVAYLAWLQEKKRRQAMHALAGRLGFSFHPGDDYGHDELYSHFEIFRRGHGRKAFNTLRGDTEVDGRRYPVVMGDFRYKQTSGSGKNRRTTTYTLSYCILHLPFAGVPSLLIRQEGFFDKIGGFLGFEDIDFESAEFSRRFFVSSSDKRFAYDVIEPRMMEYLMAGRPPTIDIEHGRCLLVNGTRRWEPHEFEGCLAFAAAFFERWPEHVTRRLAEVPA